MSGPRYRLNKYLKHIKKEGQLPSGGIVKIFSEIRQLLEVDNIKDQYVILNLYCNLMFHNKITQSNTGYKIIEAIFDALQIAAKNEIQSDSVSPTQHLINVASTSFSLGNLRKEVATLINTYQLPNYIVSDLTWRSITLELLNEVQGKSIQLPDYVATKIENLSKQDKKAKRLYNKMHEQCGGDLKLVIRSIAVKYEDETNESKEFKNAYCYNIITFGNITIAGLLSSLESNIS